MLLPTFTRFPPSILLPSQTRQEPLQHRQRPPLSRLLMRRRREQARMLDPVSREFRRGFVRQDEGWRGDVGEIARHGRYRLIYRTKVSWITKNANACGTRGL